MAAKLPCSVKSAFWGRGQQTRKSELTEELKHSCEQWLCCATLHISNKPSPPSCSPGFNVTFTWMPTPFLMSLWMQQLGRDVSDQHRVSREFKQYFHRENCIETGHLSSSSHALPKAASALWSPWIYGDWCSLHIPQVWMPIRY